MNESEPKKSWWHTLPGILTGITAIITALGGLIVAIDQTNWFSRQKSSAESEVPANAQTESTSTPSGRNNIQESQPAQGSSSAIASSGTVTLPDMRDYTVGSVVFTLLNATLTARNTETNTLSLRVRLLNNGSYGVNFWDRNFRLLIDGVPEAPNSNLNETVDGNAAKIGEVSFVVPRAAKDLKLRIALGDERTDVPLTLGD